MALHVLASINADCTNRCLASLGKQDYLLLIGDGVYALTAADLLTACQAAAREVLVLDSDLQCRLPGACPPIEVISIAQWVELSITAAPVVSWY